MASSTASFLGVAAAATAGLLMRWRSKAAADGSAADGADCGEVKVDADTAAFFKYADEHQAEYIARLAEVVAMAGVSADKSKWHYIDDTINWTKNWIETLGGAVELRDVGELDGTPLPKVIFGTIGNDPKKKTVLIYGHLDVQPAAKEDGWNTEPFVLTEEDGVMWGRGSTDDKGPVLCWLWAVEAYRKLGRELPVNLRFCFEGMEESGSVGLDDLIMDEAKNGTFFSGVDFACISDNYWLGTRKPCVTYGLRGIMTFELEVVGTGKDLHSGVFGGVVHEAVHDVMSVMTSLVDGQGKILVPGIYDLVEPMTAAERATYKSLDFDPKAFCAETGAKALNYDTKFDILTHRWRYPSLSLHGIEGAYSGPSVKTVLPGKVIGKFSIRVVPDMDVEIAEALVRKHIDAQFSKLKTPNTYTLKCGHKAPAWVSNFNDANYLAGRRAMKTVWGVEPDLTREGGSIPITLVIEEATGTSVMLLPVGRSDDGAHSQNEKLDVVNYINGVKVLGTYLEELGKA